MKKDLRDRTLYRRRVQPGRMTAFQVTVKETDLMILAERDLRAEAREAVLNSRLGIEGYIASHPGFVGSLHPLPEDEGAPRIVRTMMSAARAAGVGPMASVAGAIAEAVGRSLGKLSPEIIVENGGDVFLGGSEERVVAIYTGEEELASRLAVRIRPGGGYGVCTSSGKFGHSLSLGESSTATVLSPSAALADAAATAVGNRVRGPGGIREALETARHIDGVEGVVVVHEGRVGAWGAVEFVGSDEG